MLFAVALVSAVVLLSSSALHNESVGQLSFEQYNNQVYVRATLDKRYLAQVMQAESDCPAAIMLSECAPAYVTQHIHVKVNGEYVKLALAQQELMQRHVLLTWKVQAPNAPIERLHVQSTYMTAMTDHATLRVNCLLNELERYYTLSANRTAINVTY